MYEDDTNQNRDTSSSPPVTHNKVKSQVVAVSAPQSRPGRRTDYTSPTATRLISAKPIILVGGGSNIGKKPSIFSRLGGLAGYSEEEQKKIEIKSVQKQEEIKVNNLYIGRTHGKFAQEYNLGSFAKKFC